MVSLLLLSTCVSGIQIHLIGTWLLKHVFNPKVLGKDDFKLFLAYVNGMQGRSREDLLERAKKMDTEIVVTDKKDEKSTIERIQKNRAHTLIERYGLSVC